MRTDDERAHAKAHQGARAGAHSGALVEAGRLLRAGRFEAALATLDAVADVASDAHRLVRARALFRLGRLADARAALGAIAPDKVPDALERALRRAEGAGSDHRARQHLLAGRVEEAEGAARSALEHDPTRPGPYATLMAALDGADDPERLAGIVEGAARHARPFPALPTNVLLALLHDLPGDRAAVVARALLKRREIATSNLARAIRAVARVPDPAGAQSPVGTRSPADGPALPPVLEHLLAGRRDEAVRRAERAGKATGLLSPAAVGRLAQVLPPRALHCRPLVNDTGEPVIASTPSTSGTAVLFFFGYGGGTGTADAAILDAWPAASGTATIFLRDPQHRFFLRGVPELGNTEEGTAGALRERLGLLGARRLVSAGASAGGFAAIRYGLLLGADMIATFATPTTGRPDEVRRIGDPRGMVVAEQLQREFGPRRIDVLPDLRRGRAVPEGVHLWFGAENRLDAAHAERVGACPGVHLHPLPDCRHHGIIQDLVLDGTMGRILGPEPLRPARG